jgi:NADH-quinone oxidoreductase subunit H
MTLSAVRVLIILGMVLGFVPVLIWMERKGAAYIQDRRGPNRASIAGIRLGGVIHSVADALKLFTKEEIAARPVSKPLFYAAPMIALFVPLAVLAVIPFTQPVTLFGRTFTLQVADLGAGLIYVFALSSLGVYALLVAGWSACGKYSLLGALRSSAQMISYEAAMGLSVISIFLLSGSFRLNDIVADQGVLIWQWNVIRQPAAFILFVAALFAETNRLPFDLPEGESELVAGYHTEYSSMRFALFFMGEYTHIIAGSLVITALFIGGWQIPFVSAQMLNQYAPLILFYGWPAAAVLSLIFGLWLSKRFRRRYHDLRDFEPLLFGLAGIIVGVVLILSWAGLYYYDYFFILPGWIYPVMIFLIQLAVVMAKAFFFCAFFIWVRWTLPRFRYDQLMKLGWKVMLPLGIINIVITAAAVVFY